MGRHRKPTETKKKISRVAIFAGVVAGGLSTPAVAQAETNESATTFTENWDAVARCESSNDWSTNTGNGFFGGLQFTQSTWEEFGGTRFADRADHATPTEQKKIAERVKDGQGIGAWPVCGQHGGGSDDEETDQTQNQDSNTDDDSASSGDTDSNGEVGQDNNGSSTEHSARTGITDEARTWLGVPYEWGGENKSGADCSGLVQSVFNTEGFDLPRVADDQMHATERISRSQAQPGDLVFGVNDDGHAHHVGIYLGNNKQIDAPQEGEDVGIHSLYSDQTVFGRVVS